MPGYSHGFLSNLNQILDPPMRRKIDDLRNTVQYIQGLHTNDTAVYNIVQVSDWLQKSQDLLDDICELRIEEKIEDQFPNRLRPYLYSSLNLAIAVDDTSKKLTKQVEEGKNALRGFKRSISNTDLPGTYTYAKNAYDNILQEVSNEEARIIRVLGRPGVGKTTVVSKIHNHALDGLRSFNKVFWVSTGPNATLEDLQREIAKQMFVDLSAVSDDEGRAKALFAALMIHKRDRRILLILDLWKDFTLKVIGIPKPSTENGYKLLIICRTQLTGVSFVNEAVVEDVEIKSPSKKEIYDVFAKLVGEENIPYIPEETWSMLLEECDYLPLVAMSLEKRIKELLLPGLAAKYISEGIRNVVSSFEFPSDLLKDSYGLREQILPYFFYCALYPCQPNNPNDLIETEDMIWCWICDGLMDANDIGGEAKKTVMERGKEIVEEIKNSYLLEIVCRDEDRTQCIKMRKSVREMASRMSTDCFFIKVGAKKETIKKFVPEKVERASVMSDQLKELGKEPKNSLSTLVVRNNQSNDKWKFPVPLVNEMPNVKVLDLSGTLIQSIPNNFSKARALRLHNCLKLESLPDDMSSFVELLILDLSRTSITNLPNGLSSLKKLFRLNISYTPMRMFPFTSGLLTSLTGLQELLMMSCYVWTEQESVEDLKRLTKLAHFEANFSNLLALKKFVCSEKPEGHCPPKFRFSVGKFNLKEKLGENTLAVLMDHIPNSDLSHMVLLPVDNAVHVMRNQNLDLLPLQCYVSIFIQHLTAINVSDCGGLINLFNATVLDSAPNLRKIVVRRCKKMVALIREPEGAPYQVSLGNVQELVLFQLEKLEYICRSKLLCNSLHSISVWECDQLSSLPIVEGRGANNPIRLIKAKDSLLGQSDGFPAEMYTICSQTKAAEEIYSKPTCVDPNNAPQEKKTSVITRYKKLILSCIVVPLILAFVLYCIYIYDENYFACFRWYKNVRT